MMQKNFDVLGMTCSACSSHVEKSVAKLDGTLEVNVNLLANRMKVSFDENKLSIEDICAAVEHAGYQAIPIEKESSNRKKGQSVPQQNHVQNELQEMKKRLWLSFLFLIPLFYLSMGHMLGWPLPAFFHGPANALTFAFTQFLLTLPIIYVNRKYYQVGFKTLFRGAPNMDSLIAIGSASALIYGIYAIYQIGYGMGHGLPDMITQYSMDLYFESAGTILTLITVGKFLETRSKGKTSEAIRKLIDLAPKTAFVERNGQEQEIPVEDVQIHDIVIVKPGQSIPVDGIVIQGNSAVDESAITGESIPVEKQTHDKVIAATINKTGYFKMEATRVGDDTTLAQIISLVEEASASKAPIAKLADRISAIFVPTVITIAVLATVVWLLAGSSFQFALSIGIAVMVISCPCALGLATPVAIMVGTGKGAENGILIKSAEALEIAHHIDTVVLDKTGTITEGKPQVTDFICTPDIGEKQLLTIAAALENSSEHPLAEAILTKAKQENIVPAPVTNFSALVGLGIQADIEGKTYWAGNLRLMQEKNIAIADFTAKGQELADAGKTPLYFADQQKIIGCIAVSDIIKESSKQAVTALHEMGIEVIMLTGDNQKTAEAIRKQTGINTAIAEVLPQDKEKEIRNLQRSGRKVAMVGDGINDAPALTRADLGMAIGAGTDIAIEAADIVLMKSNLLDAVTAIQLSKATMRNIKQNLFWAFFYNSIGIPLAAGILYPAFTLKLNPMFAAAAMSLSSFCVVTNALRLKFFQPSFLTKDHDKTDTIQSQSKEKKKDNKGDLKMKTKTMMINGMTCPHCSARVEKALNAIDGVEAKVDLEHKKATITLSKDIADDILIKAVTDADYEVVSLS